MKYMVDTNIFNRLIDGTIGPNELPNDRPFVATHIQIDEIKKTRDAKRKAKLLNKFEEIIDEVEATESFVLDISRIGGAKLGDSKNYQLIKKELDARNNKKANNSQDALIAEVAMKKGYTLLTADKDLYQVAYSNLIGTIYWTPVGGAGRI